jgi:hypothetical protein
MANNKLTDLNDRLFDLFDRMQAGELEGEKLAGEISRAKVSIEIAQQIIANGSLIANACRLADTMTHAAKLPPLLTD